VTDGRTNHEQSSGLGQAGSGRHHGSANGTTSTGAVFGDPAPDTVKACNHRPGPGVIVMTWWPSRTCSVVSLVGRPSSSTRAVALAWQAHRSGGAAWGVQMLVTQ